MGWRSIGRGVGRERGCGCKIVQSQNAPPMQLGALTLETKWQSHKIEWKTEYWIAFILHNRAFCLLTIVHPRYGSEGYEELKGFPVRSRDVCSILEKWPGVVESIELRKRARTEIDSSRTFDT